MIKENVWQNMVSGEIYDAAHPSLIEKITIFVEEIKTYSV
jgi:hypothetical protein